MHLWYLGSLTVLGVLRGTGVCEGVPAVPEVLRVLVILSILGVLVAFLARSFLLTPLLQATCTMHRHASFADNTISDQGATALAIALGVNKTLNHLNLECMFCPGA